MHMMDLYENIPLPNHPHPNIKFTIVHTDVSPHGYMYIIILEFAYPFI